jgi:hypothetical protein
MAPNRSVPTDRRGSLWHRWDLHFHTPASFEYGDKSVTNEEIVERLVSEGGVGRPQQGRIESRSGGEQELRRRGCALIGFSSDQEDVVQPEPTCPRSDV